MPTKTIREDEVRYDAQAAERGFKDTTALRAAVADPTAPRGLDLQQAAVFGLRMAGALSKPDVKARFDRLPDDVLSAALRNRIGPAAWGLWYALAQRATAETKASGARVSEETLRSATAIKQRMMRVAEYMLAEDVEGAAELASIRAGVGHADLASDLTRLAALYTRHRDTLSEAGAHYRASDVRGAKDAAASILAELGSSDTPEVTRARDDASRAFRVLEEAYSQVRRFGIALFDDGETRFPSIYSIRPTRGPAAPGQDAEPEPTPPEEPIPSL